MDQSFKNLKENYLNKYVNKDDLKGEILGIKEKHDKERNEDKEEMVKLD